MSALDLPTDYHRIKVVRSFEELISTPFAAEVNALCWPRALVGDFGEVLGKLQLGEGITGIEPEELQALELTRNGELAREVLLRDQEMLREHGLAPVLEAVRSCARDEPDASVPTDVYSWHADRAPVEADTWLCTYHGAWTEALRNEEAVRRVEVPETRARLWELFREEGGSEADEEAFAEFLEERCFDLHYVPREGAKAIGFGVGNLWRIAIEWPGCPVPPCVHRAPETGAGDVTRLLLLS